MTVDVGEIGPLIAVIGGIVVLATPIYRLFVWRDKMELRVQQIEKDQQLHELLPSHPGTVEHLARLEQIMVQVQTDISWIRRSMNGGPVRDPTKPFRAE